MNLKPPSFSHLKHSLRSLNTGKLSAEEYANFYHQWGGSFIIHPDVLGYFEDTYGIKTRYRGYFRRGQCVGAVPTWGSFVAGDYSALQAYRLKDKVDFGYPAMYLPIDPEHRCLILYKAKYLLGLQRQQIAGVFFYGRESKKMALLRKIPEELPSGKKEFQIKERRFDRQGGTIRDIQEFHGEEVAAIYTDLHQQRWNKMPHAAQSLGATFSTLKKFLFGKILWLDKQAIAIQINFRADTRRTICIDYINGGVHKGLHKNISPGALLSYINGHLAGEEGRREGKLLIYSYGKANTEYKDQWCHRVSRGLGGFWLPG